MTLRFFSIVVCLVVCYACLHIETMEGSRQVTQDTISNVDYVIEEYAALSLTNKELFAPELSGRAKTKLEAQLSKALENFNSDPDNLDNIIWFGRRLANLFLFKESLKVYSDGLEKFPSSYELYRHRGHRFLTVRDFDNAVSDLQNAAFYMRDEPIRMERTGALGSRSIPRFSVQFNVWYHLGLAYYLKGNYDKAVSAYKQCLELANNDDMIVSATNWLFITYRRLGNEDAAAELLEPIKTRMNVIENRAYLDLLLMYKGQKRPDQLFDPLTNNMPANKLIYAYGVGNWYLINGQSERAFQIFNKIMESEYWPAYGFLGAEVELANRQLAV